MKFKIQNLKKLLLSIQQNNIHEIHIQSQQFKLSISKRLSNTTYSKSKNNIIKTETQGVNKENSSIIAKSLSQNIISSSKTENYSTIVSPMVGTFYRSPAPSEPPFVELYDIVQKKQTVCIIEAMKLMNEIEAELDGEIVEILVQDGDIIDCGQALMRIKPISNSIEVGK